MKAYAVGGAGNKRGSIAGTTSSVKESLSFYGTKGQEDTVKQIEFRLNHIGVSSDVRFDAEFGGSKNGMSDFTVTATGGTKQDTATLTKNGFTPVPGWKGMYRKTMTVKNSAQQNREIEDFYKPRYVHYD